MEFLENLEAEALTGKSVFDIDENAPEPTLAYWKKIFKLSLKDDNAAITGYLIDEPCVRIPRKVGRYTVNRIGYGAFEKCKALVSVVIPDTVTKIEFYAFKDCQNLKSVDLPETVSEIGSSAFDGCKNLESVTNLKNIKNVERGAFRGCEKLQDADGFVIVNNILFGYFGNKKDVVIPEGVKVIGPSAFENSKLSTISFPEGLEKIELFAFYKCSKLKKVDLPEGLKEIVEEAFYGCSGLEDVYIPSSVINIGYPLFGFGMRRSFEEKLTFHAPKGSYAEKYVKDNYRLVKLTNDVGERNSVSAEPSVDKNIKNDLPEEKTNDKPVPKEPQPLKETPTTKANFATKTGSKKSGGKDYETLINNMDISFPCEFDVNLMRNDIDRINNRIERMYVGEELVVIPGKPTSRYDEDVFIDVYDSGGLLLGWGSFYGVKYLHKIAKILTAEACEVVPLSQRRKGSKYSLLKVKLDYDLSGEASSASSSKIKNKFTVKYSIDGKNGTEKFPSADAARDFVERLNETVEYSGYAKILDENGDEVSGGAVWA